MICDAHVHFFSPGFFSGLGASKDAVATLEWDDPVSADALADRWVDELDANGVSRAAIMASVPFDADSIAAAINRHPTRFVGFVMVDPTREDAIPYTARALDNGLRTLCLFPAMRRFSLHDDQVSRLFELAASRRGVVFVHCGMLSVGVRKRLGLPSPFDLRFSNPLDLHDVALRFPTVPIVIPHFGAGMLREALMLAEACPNVYLDTSSSNSWMKYTPGLTLEGVFQSALAAAGADRLLFGTDSSFFPRGWNRDVYERQRAALDAIGAGADVQDKIFGGNFSRLF